jgi:hypothetical protein
VSTGLLGAVAGGLSIACLYAMIGSVAFGLPGGPFVRWALLASLPVASAAGLLALGALRGPGPGVGWYRFLAFPHASIALAAVGMLLLQYAETATHYLGMGLLVVVLGKVGGALLGAAAGFALPLAGRVQSIVAVPLGLFAALIGTSLTAGVLAVMYVAAAGLWWWQRVWLLAYRRLRQRARTVS